jgi:secreted PhoX family phosphatase
MALTRRSLLTAGAAIAGAAFPLSRLFGRQAPRAPGRFGALVKDPAGVFDLPKGYSYRIVQRVGETMTDGYQVPASFDGMGCFAAPEPGKVVLMRNHENTFVPGTGPCGVGRKPPPEAYDPAAQGAVTRVVLHADTLKVASSNLVLAGTVRNCAGGPSPWGWLSCEEATDAHHGYVFLCRTDAARVAPPTRIVGYGRFRHEAACVDPRTFIAYLTEDKDDSCLYRFVPVNGERPFEGKLQALAVADLPKLDLAAARLGQSFEVTWVDIDEPDSRDDTVRFQGRARGAAVLRRGEGIWLDGERVFICSTSGGPAGAGQIFRLDLGGATRKDRLSVVAQSTDTDLLNMPDNVTVSPWGEVFMAEDSVGGVQHLRVLSPDGIVSDFARNALSRSELAGVCFSPDGRTLFVNIYGDGLTLAIRGPFPSA